MKFISVVIISLASISNFSAQTDTCLICSVIDSLKYKATILYQQGNYYETINTYKELKYLYLIKSGNKSTQYLLTVKLIALIYYELMEYEQAEPYFFELDTLIPLIYGINSRFYPDNLNSIGNIFFSQNLITKAENYYQKAASQYRNLSDSNGYFISLMNLANCYQISAHYSECQKIYDEILTYQSHLSDSLGQTNYSNTLHNIGNFYLEIGQYEKAKECLLKSKSIIYSLQGPKGYDYYLSLRLLGIIYSEDKDQVAAKRYTDSAVIILLNNPVLLGPDSAEYTSILIDIGVRLAKEKELENAKDTLYKALRIAIKNDYNLERYATILHNLGEIFYSLNELDSSEFYLHKALVSFNNLYGETNPRSIRVLKSLSILFISRNNFEKGLEIFNNTQKYDQDQFINSMFYLSESEQIQYEFTLKEDLDKFISVGVSLINGQNESFNTACYNLNLFYNNVVATNLRNTRQRFLSDSTNSVLYNDLIKYKNQYLRQINRSEEKNDTLLLAELANKINLIENLLLKKTPKNILNQKSTWWDIQKALKTNEANIEFLTYNEITPNGVQNNNYCALVTTKNNSFPQLVKLFEESEIISTLNNTLYNDIFIINNLYYNDNKLYQLLLKPLIPYLDSINTIYYTPSGYLNFINPEGIYIDKINNPFYEMNWIRITNANKILEGKFANEEYIDKLKKNNSNALLIGGLNYDMDSTEFIRSNIYNPINPITYSNQEDYISNKLSVENNTLIQRGPNAKTWSFLQGSKEEVLLIEGQLRKSGFNVTLFSNLSGTEENFLSYLDVNQSPIIMHFATHSFVLPHNTSDNLFWSIIDKSNTNYFNSSMMRTGLVMSGANYYSINNKTFKFFSDQLLYSEEIKNLNLANTVLVVLSACQTALGDIWWREGVTGIQRAFYVAGAKFQIITLWNIPDKESKELMEAFYSYWIQGNMSLRDAFNKAKKTIKTKYKSPYYWAGFVLIE